MTSKTQQRKRRHRRVRGRIAGTAQRPRLCVTRSSRSFSAQLIDDERGTTIIGMSTAQLPAGDRIGTKTEQAHALGVAMAQQAQGKDITAIVFDRAGYRYHGRVKAFAQGAREGGLEF